MKHFKLLPLVLLFGIIIISGCEKSNNWEEYACETDDVCPIEWLGTENTEATDTETEQPMMRKILVDENMTDEEIQESLNESCQNAGWTWTNWTCMLEDGTQIAF
jgi:hypothetical protein